MNPEQYSAYSESLSLCRKLLWQLEQDRENISECMSGEILTAYLKSLDTAVQKVHNIISKLNELQNMQPKDPI